jgi:uncharacterized protein YggE
MKAAGLLIAALLGAAAPALAQTRPSEPGTIDVVGHAARAVAPDVATVQVGVSTRAATAAAALDQNSNAARAIADAARAFGIAPADINTSNVSLGPTYRMVRDSGGGSQQLPDGYQAENTVELHIRDLARLGEFLRKTLDGGANRITGLSFGLTDPRSMNEQVRQDAVADAIRQAQLLAAAAGVKLGAVRRLRLGGGTLALPPNPMPRMQMRAAAIPVEAGSLDVTADVEMSWVIEQP